MHVTYCTIRRSVLIKKLLLVLENVYLIPVVQLHMSLVHGVRIYNCLIFFFFGGGGKIVYKKKISRLDIRYTNYHETEKNHVRKLILSTESKILGLFIKIIFEIFPLKVGYMYFIMNFLISGYLCVFRCCSIALFRPLVLANC